MSFVRSLIAISLFWCVGLSAHAGPPPQPDLVPVAAPGAALPIVISDSTQTNSDDPVLAGSQVYVDFAIENVANGSVALPSVTQLLLDGVLVAEVATPLLDQQGNALDVVLDVPLVVVEPGSHTLLVRVDATDVISESDESNNEFERTIVALPPAYPAGVAIVFLPGVLSSQLHCGNTAEAFWPTASASRLLHLHFLRSGGSWVTNVTAPQELDFFPGCTVPNPLDPFCRFETAANDFRFVAGDIHAPVVGESFFFHPYDWRQSIVDIVGFDASGNFAPGSLCDRLAALQGVGITEIYLVAHSMGSLVAREYLAVATTSPLLPDVTKVVFAGAPFLGSAELLRALLYGRDIGSAAVSKAVLREMPGPYFLIPSREYFDAAWMPAPLRYDWGVGGVQPPQRATPWVLDQFDAYWSFLREAEIFRPEPWLITRELLDVEVVPPIDPCAVVGPILPERFDTANDANLTLADDWHSLRDSLPLPTGVDVFSIRGRGRPTATQFREWPTGEGGLLLDVQFVATAGDGAVSRTSMQGVVAAALEHFDLDTEHSEYFFDEATCYDILHLLADSVPSSITQLATALPTIGPPLLPDVVLHANGPAFVHARIGGFHVGPTSGGFIDEEIAGTFHYRVGETDTYEAIIVNDTTAALTGFPLDEPLLLEVEGLAAGQVHVKLDRALGAEETLELDYGDVPVTTGSRWFVDLNDPLGDYTLYEDSNFDGVWEDSRAPMTNHLFFVRADVDADGSVTLADLMATAEHLFGGIPAPCERAADVNGDEAVDIADMVAFALFFYQLAPPPPPPYPHCGNEPSRFDCRDSSC